MKAKRNRYDLSLWDIRKLSLYGRAQESVQIAALIHYPAAAVSLLLAKQLNSGHHSLATVTCPAADFEKGAALSRALENQEKPRPQPLRTARADRKPVLPASLATNLLYFNQDGIKRGRVAHVGKFF